LGIGRDRPVAVRDARRGPLEVVGRQLETGSMAEGKLLQADAGAESKGPLRTARRSTEPRPRGDPGPLVVQADLGVDRAFAKAERPGGPGDGRLDLASGSKPRTFLFQRRQRSQAESQRHAAPSEDLGPSTDQWRGRILQVQGVRSSGAASGSVALATRQPLGRIGQRKSLSGARCSVI
jgi:hypothetical protein